MKKVSKPSTILKWQGELVEVIGISEGRTIHMRSLSGACSSCGQVKAYDFLEHSPLFQENAEPVDTLDIQQEAST